MKEKIMEVQEIKKFKMEMEKEIVKMLNYLETKTECFIDDFKYTDKSDPYVAGGGMPEQRKEVIIKLSV